MTDEEKPRITPDGRFWWDGATWRPLPGGARPSRPRRRRWPWVAGLLGLLAVVWVAIAVSGNPDAQRGAQDAAATRSPQATKPSPVSLTDEQVRQAVLDHKECPTQADTLRVIAAATFTIAHDQPRGTDVVAHHGDVVVVAIGYTEAGQYKQAQFNYDRVAGAVTGADPVAVSMLGALLAECG